MIKRRYEHLLAV